MNKQIRDLAEQAGYHWGSYDSFGLFDVETFAELIVRECAELAKHHVMNISTYSDADFVEKQIIEHFGIKESE